ncbi:ATP-binding protein, partial [Sphingobium sp. Z007]|uniref:ATP-binding protein n=1 Tax=Sphingobium sp. Z007 TaxID=627495 RepID=UPI00359360D3
RRGRWTCPSRKKRRPQPQITVCPLPGKQHHETFGDPAMTVADAILDRLVHNAHRLDLDGDSKRRSKGNRPA